LLVLALLGSALSPALAVDGRPPVLREVGVDQRLGEIVPLEARFRDETGREVALGEYFGRKPVVLSLVYHTCPMLCGQSTNGLAGSLKALAFDAGRDFTVLSVSFDARDTPETARQRRTAALARYGRPRADAGWHFLTGDDDAIGALTRAVGFRWTRVPETGEWAHAAATIVVTADGRISRYFYGVEPPPRDLRLGLVEASSGRIGTVVDHILLFCYRYDPATGRYSAAVLNAVRAGGALTVLALATLLAVLWRREARGSR
jgi:protein SCO1/2